MDRQHITHGRTGHRSRVLLAMSLVAAFAASGCTSNHPLGYGAPAPPGPELRSHPTAGVTTGSKPPGLPPMTSSYTGDTGTERAARFGSRADEAAAIAVAIMAQHQAAHGRYLGVVDPGVSGRHYASDGQIGARLTSPALQTNPQRTVNSTISSSPTAVINSSGEVVADGAAGAIFTDAARLGGLASAGVALPVGAFAASTVTPATAISGNPTPTVAASSSAVAGTSVQQGASLVAPAANPPRLLESAPIALRPVSPANGTVRVLREPGGTVTVTNRGSN